MAVSFWRERDGAGDEAGRVRKIEALMIGVAARRGNVVAGWTVTQMFARWIASLRSQ